MLKKLFTNSFLYGIGPQVPRLANIFVLPLITPFLSATDYGIQGVLSSYTGLLGGLSELGLTIILVNTFYEYQSRDNWKFHWKRIFGFLSIWSVFYAILMASIIYNIMPNEASENKLSIVCILFIQSALFSSTIAVSGRLYQLIEKPQYISTVTIITGLVTVGVNLVTIKYMKLGYMGWYYSGLTGSVLMFCFYVIPLLNKYKLSPSLKFSNKYLMKHLKVALPTLPHNYSNYLLNSSDRLVMDRLEIPLNDLGTYNVGYSFGSYFSVIGTALGMAQGPIMAKLWFDKTLASKQQIRLLVFAMQILFLALGFLLAIWSKEILPMLYRSKDFEGAYLFAGVIFMSYVYYPMYWGSINKLIYEKKTNQLWKISAVAGIANVILNLVFIPIFGPIAAAISTFICLMYVGFSGFYLSAYKELNDINYYPIHWLILIIIMMFSSYLLSELNLITKSGITIIICLIIFGFFYRYQEDIKEITI